MSARFDRASLWSETKVTACLAAGTLVLALVAPRILPDKIGPLVAGFALFASLVLAWQCAFYGTTLVSVKLQGENRRRFQIAISLAVPAVLMLYFVYRAEAIDPMAAGLLSSWWVLVAPLVIAFVCYKLSENLHPDHPFRGFLIAALVLFWWCFLKEQGVYFEGDDYDEGSSMFMSEEKAEHAQRTGEYVLRYVLYVAAAYIGLLVGLMRSRRLVLPENFRR
jgi:hypothetical protein